MKSMFTLFTVLIATSSAFASDYYCGASQETEKGSGVYNKSLFWDKVDGSALKAVYVLTDGAVIRAEDLDQATLAKIVDGTLSLLISIKDNKTTLVSGHVQRSGNDPMKIVDQAISSAPAGVETMLIGNGALIYCTQH